MSRFVKRVAGRYYWARNYWDPKAKQQKQTTEGHLTGQEITEYLEGKDEIPEATTGVCAEAAKPSPEPMQKNETQTTEVSVEPPVDVSGLPSAEEAFRAFAEGYRSQQGVLALLRLVDPGLRYVYGIDSSNLMKVYESVARASRGILDEEDSNNIDWPYSDEMPKEAMLRREECG